jgi:hypothetical protein
MPTHYLLPCQCGKKTEIDSSQSGLTIRCACGTELTVPAMRGLAALERLEAAPRAVVSEPGPSWGAQQGFVFLGSTIVVVAALAAFAIWWFRMPEPLALNENYQETNRAIIDQQPPDALIVIWQDARNGIEQRQGEEMLDHLDRVIAEVLGWEMIFGAIGAVGLVLVLIGLFMRVGRPAATLTPARAA